LALSGRVVSIRLKQSLKDDLAVIEAEMRNADGQAAVLSEAKAY
jgi:hypothetical protein